MVASWELKEQKKIACFVLHVDTTSVAWALGIRNLLPHSMPIIPLAGMPYDMARNVACQTVLREGYENLAFLDSDVIPQRDAFVRLMSHGLPIVSGVYHRRSPPHGVPVMLRGNPPTWLTSYPPNALIEVDYVGAGLMVIHRSVLERLPPQRPGHHWFDWRVQFSQLPPEMQPQNVGPHMSEDFTFNSHCRAHGYRIMVDTGVQSRHVGFAQATFGKMEPCETTHLT